MSLSVTLRTRPHVEGLEDRTTPSASGLLDALPILPTAAASDMIAEAAQLSPLSDAVADVGSTVEAVVDSIGEPLTQVAESPFVDAALTPVRVVAEGPLVMPLMEASSEVLESSGVGAIVAGVEQSLEPSPLGPLVGDTVDAIHEIGGSALGEAWESVVPIGDSAPGLTPPHLSDLPSLPVLPGGSAEAPATLPSFGTPFGAALLSFVAREGEFRIAFDEAPGEGDVSERTDDLPLDASVTLTDSVALPDTASEEGGEDERVLRSEHTLAYERLAATMLPEAQTEAPSASWTGWLYGLGQIVLGTLALAWFIHFDRKSRHLATSILRRPAT